MTANFSLWGRAGRLWQGRLRGGAPPAAAGAAGAAAAATADGGNATTPQPPRPVREALSAYAQNDIARQREPAAPAVQVADAMERDTPTVACSTSAAEARQLLAATDADAVPVVDRHEHLIGMVVQPEDAARAGAGSDDDASATGACDTMLTPVPAATPETDLRAVSQVLDALAIDSLPVTDAEGSVVGRIGRDDIARAEARPVPKLDCWG